VQEVDMRKTLAVALVLVGPMLAWGKAAAPVCPDADRIADPREGAPLLQLAILLDTSNSMDGLIEQAQGQLWRIVNEMATAKRRGKAARLEVALYEYGNDRLTASTGYVRRVLPFTSDLDRVSEGLFALTTKGGSEYCGTVIQTALDELRWSPSPGDLKVVFIAGNEPFTQGPVDFRKVCRRAHEDGVVVNTIHCGSHDEGARTGWREGALLASGAYSTIDQDRRVEHVAAPQDADIARLGQELNNTYVPYGHGGRDGAFNQVAQDSNSMKSAGGATERAVTKANQHYKNSGWDLVDAVGDALVELEKMKDDELPEDMRKLKLAERKAFLEAKAKDRKRLQAEIQRLNAARAKHVAETQQKKTPAADAKDTLDVVIAEALRREAACKGITLD
jgi:hypothetical protein